MWKKIFGYEDYFVSSAGELKSFKRCKVNGKLRKLSIDKDGYCVVGVYDSAIKKHKILKIHRLVAEAFVETPNNYECVDHINSDKSDNRAENLRWCSFGQNTRFYHNDNPGITRRANGKWRARRHLDAKRINIGTFETKEEAIIALREFDKKNGII